MMKSFNVSKCLVSRFNMQLAISLEGKLGLESTKAFCKANEVVDQISCGRLHNCMQIHAHFHSELLNKSALLTCISDLRSSLGSK